MVDPEQYLHLCIQGNRSVTTYLRSFKNITEAIKATGGSLGLNSVANRVMAIEMGLDYESAGQDKKDEIIE